jgi:hypothetical protein
MKIFCTRWCLTAGIEEMEAESVPQNGMVTVKRQNGWPYMESHIVYLHGEGQDWHRTREQAVVRANVVRVKQIAAMNKQLAKLAVPFK